MAVVDFNESTQIRERTKTLDLAPSANSLDDIFVAPTTAADGVRFIQTGREVVTVKNSHASSAFTFTIKSVADELKRTGDVGPYTLQAGESVTFPLHPTAYKDANGKVTIVMDNAAVVVAVNRMPGYPAL